MIKKGMNKLEQAKLRKAVAAGAPIAGIRQVFRRIHPDTLDHWVEYFEGGDAAIEATKAHAKQREADSEIETAEQEAAAAEETIAKATVKKEKAIKKKAGTKKKSSESLI